MATEEGNLIYIAVDEEIVECLMTSTINFTAAKVVESTQCSGGFEDSSPGTIEANVQIEGKISNTSSMSAHQIIALLFAGTKVPVYWGGNKIGDVYYSATGWVSNMSISTNHSEKSKPSFSGTLQLAGIVTPSTVTASTLV